MIKILHILAGADIGGISQVVVNYYKFINKNKFVFDIAFTTECEGQNMELLKKMGAKIYQLPLKSQGIKKFEDELEVLLRSNSYDCVHVHENSTSYVALRVAKKVGIKTRIAHAHSCVAINTVIDKLRRLSGKIFNYLYSTDLIACGEMAGNIVFGKLHMKSKKAVILKNAIDSELFKFDQKTREEYRSKYQLSNKYILGMVGRLSNEKNIYFSLNLMRKLVIKNPNIHLFIVGEGSERYNLEKYINENKLDDYVTLFGKTKEVEKFYQMFDLLLLPSFYEGLPLVVVEACASGLPVISSDNVSKEILCFRGVEMISLRDEMKWEKEIENTEINDDERINKSLLFKDSGFDLSQNVQILENIYMK